MQWFEYVMSWYIMLLGLGFVFFPICSILFNRFADKGYAMAKTAGIIGLSYSVFALSTTHVVPFSRTTLFGILLVVMGFNYWLYTKKYFTFPKKTKLMLAEEALFLVCFVIWAYVRSQEPAIRGLEKFMDFGFINSAARSTYFPVADMWLAGKSINYYYFGHLTGAVLNVLSGIPSYIGYNLTLATLFGLGITQTFSLAFTLGKVAFGNKMKWMVTCALLAAFLVNLGGNLHSVYTLTTGYGTEKPIPFWQLPTKTFFPLNEGQTILDKLGEGYWYPNATRFIPYTIHEFPIYSYVVADLHGHVFDIPFVLFTLALMLMFVLKFSTDGKAKDDMAAGEEAMKSKTGIGGRLAGALQWAKGLSELAWNYVYSFINGLFRKGEQSQGNAVTKLAGLAGIADKTKGAAQQDLIMYAYAVLIGFMLSIHYMTNAFDAPIYLLLAGFVILVTQRLRMASIAAGLVILASFIVFALPFNLFFEPFASSIGVNCAPQFLVEQGKIGPFVFEKDKCQLSEWWHITILWGFIWFHSIIFAIRHIYLKISYSRTDMYVACLFALSVLLIVVPEFIYAKDIYPDHFRANTMFKLGYQAFIMGGIASAYVFVRMKQSMKRHRVFSVIYLAAFIPLFLLVAVYPSFAINSYYGNKLTTSLDGQEWIATNYIEYTGIINYLNAYVTGQPVILEAQGDSYTDYNVVSSYTGLPTIAGWPVHEWLWRGSYDVIGKVIPDVKTLYESPDEVLTRQLLTKYQIEYVVIGPNERARYTGLNEQKFDRLGKAVFRTLDRQGAIYKIPLDSI